MPPRGQGSPSTQAGSSMACKIIEEVDDISDDEVKEQFVQFNSFEDRHSSYLPS
jgi:hypothetical protein